MRIAIIGLGGRISGVAANVVKAAKAANQHITWVGFADPMEKPIGLKTLPDIGPGYRDHREMLQAVKPDAVMIGSPNHLHLEHIRDSLAAGCKVFSEKPVVISVEESWQAAELLKQYGQDKFLVGLVLRSSPLFRTAMELIASGRLGTAVSMEANELLGPEHGAFIARDWRRLRKYSGSHILEKCCHDIDLLQALLGGRIRKVASFGGRAVFTPENTAIAKAHVSRGERYTAWKSGWAAESTDDSFTADSDIVDHQVFSAEMETGAKLTFHCNNQSAFGQRRWVWCGQQGAWESDFATGTWRVQEVFGKPEVHVPAGSDGGHYGADDAMAADLVATWFTGKPFPVPTRAAIEAGLAAMGIDQAQREGRVVDLTPWWAKLDALLGAAPRHAPAAMRG